MEQVEQVEQVEQCIICLDELTIDIDKPTKCFNKKDVLQLPSKRSTCTCIGYVHDDCIHSWFYIKNHKKMCPICLMPFKTPILWKVFDNCAHNTARFICTGFISYIVITLCVTWFHYVTDE